jgi:YegS/Rv2252/BmrU family lipid kinase
VTTTTRPALVVNPTKARDIGQLRRTIDQQLADVGEPLWLETTADDPGSGQVREAIAWGADLVMAYGGDGTQRACAASLANTDVPLALLPAGTGNLLARQLGVPTRLDRAIEVSLHGGRRRIDVCGASGDRFVVMAGMGFDARMLASTSDALKERIGWLAYGLSGLHAAGSAPMLRIRLEMDGGRCVLREGVGVLVANVGTLPGGITLLPQAVEDDGLLTVAVLTPDRLLEWAALAARLLVGAAPTPAQLPCWQTTALRVTVDRPVPLEVDGEVLGARCQEEFVVAPRSLTVCVPAEGSR